MRTVRRNPRSTGFSSELRQNRINAVVDEKKNSIDLARKIRFRAGRVKSWMLQAVVVKHQLKRGNDNYPRTEEFTVTQAHRHNVEFERKFWKRQQESPENPGRLWRWVMEKEDRKKWNVMSKKMVRFHIEHPRGCKETDSEEEFARKERNHWDMIEQIGRDIGFRVLTFEERKQSLLDCPQHKGRNAWRPPAEASGKDRRRASSLL